MSLVTFKISLSFCFVIDIHKSCQFEVRTLSNCHTMIRSAFRIQSLRALKLKLCFVLAFGFQINTLFLAHTKITKCICILWRHSQNFIEQIFKIFIGARVRVTNIGILASRLNANGLRRQDVYSSYF